MTELDIRRTLRRMRGRRRREGVTLVEIMIVVIIMALIATGAAVVVLPRLEQARIDSTRTDAATVRGAVEMYLAERPGGECPSVEDLTGGGYLSGTSRTTDAWDNAYSIECDGMTVTVISAGPDGQPGTEDDIQ